MGGAPLVGRVHSATGIGIGNDEALAGLLARGARHEAEARARLLAADFAGIRERALAFAEAVVEGRASRAIPLLAELLPCARAAGDGDVAARVLLALDHAARTDSAAAPGELAALARARTALVGDARGAASGRLATSRRDVAAEDRGGPASLAARVSLLGHAVLDGSAPGSAPDADREERFRKAVAALLAEQDEDGGWSGGEDGEDATACVLDDALALALLHDGGPRSGGDAIVAASAARALARLAATQSPAGDWRRDLRSTISNLRAAMLLLPLVEARHPGVLDAAAFPAAARDGRFVERGFAWCLSRKPDLGWVGADGPDRSPDEALALAVAGAALVREHGTWRESDPLATARSRGLA